MLMQIIYVKSNVKNKREEDVMLWDRINRFWKVSGGRGTSLLGMICMIVFIIAGCSDKSQKISDIDVTTIKNEISFVSDITGTAVDSEVPFLDKGDCIEAENIALVYHDIYEEAVKTNTLDSLETKQRIVNRLGENGYVAVDSENQVDMAGAEQAVKFCKAVDEKETHGLTIIVIMELGFQKFDLETQDGKVNIVRGYYEYDKNGCLQNRSTISYFADVWKYTEEGYIIFEGSYFADENFVLTLSDTPEHVALRVLPLDKKCREWNQKFILPVSYEQNNIFLTDWSEEDFGDLDFYDIFDKFYPILYRQPIPYIANENLGVETVYKIPEDIFETVIMSYFNVDRNMLRSKTIYKSEEAAYEYRPRGFYEVEYCEIPYPEVVSYTENQDGTITLIINAVYPNENTSRSYLHKTVVRPLSEHNFQYISNQMISLESDCDLWWHSNRLTEEEQKEICKSSIQTLSDNMPQQSDTELEEESLWFLPQSEKSLISEEEKSELKKAALTAAEQVKEVYKEIELTGVSSYGSNIKEFAKEQCQEVVTLLGNVGYVSVTEATNMENYQEVEAFYTAYIQKQDAMVTIFNVNQDGFIDVITFIYRNNELQTYYVGVGWQEGGIPRIKNTLVSDIAELKLTEKGYFIYAYENLIAHSSLRQYWRIKPLSEKCRKLTAKYVSGLSYVNYNVLVTNWDSNNVEDVLMPCMFEDLYRIYSGENLKVENWRIPAKIYEKIMTTYFPVSIEQLQEKCGYDKNSNSYAYEMIFASPYPPFGEVVDYTENSDGTITLYVDAVWADYNSDCAFTNQIVVQPFSDGTFRYLSNSIEQRELEVPKVKK